MEYYETVKKWGRLRYADKEKFSKKYYEINQVR